MSSLELSPLQKVVFSTIFAAGTLALLYETTHHADVALDDLNTVAAYEHAHPQQNLPPDLAQLQHKAYEQAVLGISELAAAAGIAVAQWKLIDLRGNS